MTTTNDSGSGGKQSHLVGKYFKVHVETAPKDELLMMVLDGAVRFVERGRAAMEKDEIEEKNTFLLKAQALLVELNNALSPDIGEKLYRNLRGLYFFVYRRLVEANISNSVENLDEGLEILLHVRETWRRAIEDYRTSLVDESAVPADADGSTPRLSVSG